MVNKLVWGFLILALLQGCTIQWQEPLMLQKDDKETEYSVLNRENNYEKYRESGKTAAALGWSDINDYQRSHDVYYLKSAGRNFNYCYNFDHHNYNSYWGWGIIMGIRASQTNDADAQKLYSQSIDLFKLAVENNIPEKEKNNFYLDWSNAYNGLGTFYAQNDEFEKSLPQLDKGLDFLQEVLKQEPHNGRACFLLSLNYYCRKDYSTALLYANNAVEYQFALPQNYIDNLQKQKCALPPEK